MKRFSTLADLDQIKDDPYLWREVYGFMSACAAEILEYADEEDLNDHDFNLTLLSDDEQSYLESLGVPEETAYIVLKENGQDRIISRFIYAVEIVIIDGSTVLPLKR